LDNCSAVGLVATSAPYWVDDWAAPMADRMAVWRAAQWEVPMVVRMVGWWATCWADRSAAARGTTMAGQKAVQKVAKKVVSSVVLLAAWKAVRLGAH
jgi:hypothetical protein